MSKLKTKEYHITLDPYTELRFQEYCEKSYLTKVGVMRMALRYFLKFHSEEFLTEETDNNDNLDLDEK